MLSQRIMTAAILLPLLLALVCWGSTPLVFGVLTAVGVVIAWEWAGLTALRGGAARALYAAMVGGFLLAAWNSPQRDSHILPALLWLTALWWLAVPLLFGGFPENLQRKPIPTLAMAALGTLLVVTTILALVTLHGMDNGTARLLYVLFLVFAADTGAYFAGRRFGKRKLAPKISPGKSIEGAYGGLALCALWAVAGAIFIFDLHGVSQVLGFVLLSLVVAVASIVGDLTESMFKRVAGVKDSGTILPGHGGMLDRVDSILAAVPVMTLGLMLLEL